MNHDFTSSLPKTEIIFVIGDNKNAGKTTFLKYLLNGFRKKGLNALVLSAGIDGERADHVFGTQKPDIVVKKDEYVITSESAINNSDAAFEIMEVFTPETCNQEERPILAKTLRTGNVEIVRPGSNSAISPIIDFAITTAKPDVVLIDGAADRITQIASSNRADFYFILRVDTVSFNSSLNKIKKIYTLSQIEKDNGKTAENKIYLEGALTKNKLEQIAKDKKEIVVEDFTKVFLEPAELNALLRNKKLYFSVCYNLKAVVVILKDIDQQTFFASISQENSPPIIINPYEVNVA